MEFLTILHTNAYHIYHMINIKSFLDVLINSTGVWASDDKKRCFTCVLIVMTSAYAYRLGT